MLRWFQALMPREDKFFDMFARHAETIAKGSVSLRGVLQGGPDVAKHAAEVSTQEHMADEIAREVMLAVRRTFITPFDRSDISGLATALDDAIDQMQRTTKKIDLFDVRGFEPMMVEMGDVIVEASDLVVKLIGLLPNMRANSARISALNVQMTKLEEKADGLHDHGIKALFLAHRTDDPMAFVVGSEIYDNLEKVVDRLEDIANRISDIVIENM